MYSFHTRILGCQDHLETAVTAEKMFCIARRGMHLERDALYEKFEHVRWRSRFWNSTGKYAAIAKYNCLPETDALRCET